MEVSDRILAFSFSAFRKFGIKSISMDDIAKGTSISKKTLYQHYKTKDDLVRATLMLCIQNDKAMIKKIVEESRDAIDAIISIAHFVLSMLKDLSPSVMFDLQKYYPNLFSLMEKDHFLFIENVIKANLTRGKEEGYYRTDMEEILVAKFYIKLSISIMRDEDEFIQQTDKSKLYKEIMKYHLQGILNERGLEYVQNHQIL